MKAYLPPLPSKLVLNGGVSSMLTIFYYYLDDYNRVNLSRILGHPYINASFINVRYVFSLKHNDKNIKLHIIIIGIFI